MSVYIDSKVNYLENKLSDYASYLGVGLLTGPVKILLGTFQAVTALALAILLALPSLVKRNSFAMQCCCVHIKHGLGNIAAGIFETVPIIGTVLYYIRRARSRGTSRQAVYLSNRYEHKWMPYASLIERDFGAEAIRRGVKRSMKKTLEARDIYNQEMGRLGGEAAHPYQQKMQVAKHAIAQVLANSIKQE